MAPPALIYLGGRGMRGAVTVRGTTRLAGFSVAASSGAALALIVYVAGGARALRSLLRRRVLLLSGMDAPDRRLLEAQSLLRDLGVDPARSVPAHVSVLAFDCGAKLPVVLRAGTLAEVMVACTSLVPFKLGARSLVDLEILLAPQLMASHMSAFACFAPRDGHAPPGDVFGLLDRVLARACCSTPLFEVSGASLDPVLLAAALLLYVLQLTRACDAERSP